MEAKEATDRLRKMLEKANCLNNAAREATAKEIIRVEGNRISIPIFFYNQLLHAVEDYEEAAGIQEGSI